jgi:hypothetical protein
MSQTVNQLLSLNVLPAIVPVPLVVTTTVLPDAKVGVPYSQRLASTGGTAPYIWSIIAGDLPSGLSMDSTGLISGTPTTPTTAPVTFTASVTDSGA